MRASSRAASRVDMRRHARRGRASIRRCSTVRELKAFSQELRLASTGEGPFQWLVGAFYQDVDREYGQNLPTPGYDAITVRLGRRSTARSSRAAGHAVLLAS